MMGQRPKFLRSKTNYQGINTDTLRAQNMESGPFFNQVTLRGKILCIYIEGQHQKITTRKNMNWNLQVTADLTPLNSQKVAVKFDFFKIAGVVSIQ